MVFEFINGISLTALGLGLLVAIIIAAEIGRTIGRRTAKKTIDKEAGNLATASLGLLALLIAFTYSMALARYDARRSLVLEEANAIGSTANFALMLPQKDQPFILNSLRDYAKIRLELGVPYNPVKMAHDILRTNQILNGLWQNAVGITAEQPQSLPAYRYVASLNETNNLAEKRLTALRNHVPVIIVFTLAGTALIAMGFVGYSAGISGVSHHVSTIIMSALLAFLIIMTQDLGRPDRGAIEVSNQALSDTLSMIPSPIGIQK